MKQRKKALKHSGYPWNQSKDDDSDEVRWSWRRDESGRGKLAFRDVVDEVSEEVDSRGKVMRSEKNDW